MGNRSRKRNKWRWPLGLLLLLVAPFSCKEPLPTHQLQVIPEHCLYPEDTLFFLAPMPDTTQTYQLAFTARTDRKFQEKVWNLEVLATAPSGKTYVEQITLPLEENAVVAYLAQCQKEKTAPAIHLITGQAGNDWAWIYRKGIRPNENGTWTVAVRFIIQEPITGLHCFGMTCTTE